MLTSKMLAAAAVLCLGTAGAEAATAHNSQAGAFGSTKNACAPTPYFPEGGCITSYVTGRDDGNVLPRYERYRERPPLRPLDR